MKTVTKIAFFSILFLSLFSEVKAQLKVGNNPTTINPSAMLEVEATNKGFLPPKVALTNLTSAAPLAAHVQGMIVYNTTTATDLTPGLYMSDGTKWGRMKLGGDMGGDESGDFASTGVTIDLNTPTTSEVCAGPICIRYGGTNTTSKLEIKHNLPNSQYYHAFSYYGVSGGSGTYTNKGTILSGIWSPIYDFCCADNTDGAVTNVTMIDRATGKIRSYNIIGHIIHKDDSTLGSSIVFIRILKN